MSRKFQNLLEDMNLHIQESKQIPRKYIQTNAHRNPLNQQINQLKAVIYIQWNIIHL